MKSSKQPQLLIEKIFDPNYAEKYYDNDLVDDVSMTLKNFLKQGKILDKITKEMKFVRKENNKKNPNKIIVQKSLRRIKNWQKSTHRINEENRTRRENI